MTGGIIQQRHGTQTGRAATPFGCPEPRDLWVRLPPVLLQVVPRPVVQRQRLLSSKRKRGFDPLRDDRVAAMQERDDLEEVYRLYAEGKRVTDPDLIRRIRSDPKPPEER